MRIKLTITLVHQRIIENPKPANTQIKKQIGVALQEESFGKIQRG